MPGAIFKKALSKIRRRHHNSDLSTVSPKRDELPLPDGQQNRLSPVETAVDHGGDHEDNNYHYSSVQPRHRPKNNHRGVGGSDYKTKWQTTDALNNSSNVKHRNRNSNKNYSFFAKTGERRLTSNDHSKLSDEDEWEDLDYPKDKSKMYGNVNVGLHQSQKVGDPPRIRRHLVKNIVAQFNEEAKRRELLKDFDHDANNRSGESDYPNNGDYYYYHQSNSSPLLVETTIPNQNVPFSYTAASQGPPAFLSRRSRSEHDLKASRQSPDDVIYAQVVVNGNAGNGTSNKRTVHTRIPNSRAKQQTGSAINLNGYQDDNGTHSMTKNQSISMGNLLSGRKHQVPSKLGGGNEPGFYLNTTEHDGHMQRKHVTEDYYNSQTMTTRSRSESPAVRLVPTSSYDHVLTSTPVKEKNSNSEVTETFRTKEFENNESGGRSTTRETEKLLKRASSPPGSRTVEIKEESYFKENVKKEQRSRPRNPSPDYGREHGHSHKLHKDAAETVTESLPRQNRSKKREKAFGEDFSERLESGKREPSPDYKFDTEMGRSKFFNKDEWRNESQLNGFNANDNNAAWRIEDNNAAATVDKKNIHKTEIIKEERVVTRRHRRSGSRSPNRDETDKSTARKHKHRVSDEKKSEKFVKTSNGNNLGFTKNVAEDASTIIADKRSKINEATQTSSTNNITTLPKKILKDESEKNKKYYYFGTNDGDFQNGTRATGKSERVVSEQTAEKSFGNVGETLSSTRLVREADAKVSGQLHSTSGRYASAAVAAETQQRSNRTAEFKQRSTRERSKSPAENYRLQDSGYSSRAGGSSPEKELDGSSHVQNSNYHHVESRKHNRMQTTSRDQFTSAFGEDAEDRMETSESDDLPSLRLQARHHSGSQGSNPAWSSLDEEEENLLQNAQRDTDDDIVSAHINTPQSITRELGKHEISYENSQRCQEKAYQTASSHKKWFDHSDVESDYRREMSGGGDHSTSSLLRNDNHLNNNSALNYNNLNNSWESATLSRLETKNKMNDHVTRRAATMDRRHHRNHQEAGNVASKTNDSSGLGLRILLNGRDVTDSPQELAGNESTELGGAASGRLGSYQSETESQHSQQSKSSRKSSGSRSPTTKRVNFKTKSSKSRRSNGNSSAELSPVHREAMLRASSPGPRPSSAADSVHSGSADSNGSSRSVILHAPAVADIPPARSYRNRIYRDAAVAQGQSTSTPSSRGNSPKPRSSKKVTRSFSLLSPWKPRKYKEKYEHQQQQRQETSSRTPTPDTHVLSGGRKPGQKLKVSKASHNNNNKGANNSATNSAEHLDSLSPLPSDTPPPNPGTVGPDEHGKSVSRTQSMPKDSRFAGFFSKKKNKDHKDHHG